MNQYQKLISTGKIKKCIDAFLGIEGEVRDQAILLSARWNKNEEKNQLGIIDSRDYNVSRNKIVSVLSQIALGLSGGNISTDLPSVEFEINNSYTSENILALIQHFSRRNPEVSESFEQCLKLFDSYQQAKIQFAGHDATGRQKTRMQADFEIIYNNAINTKADNFEEEIAEIQKLLTFARVPTIPDIIKAYAIASGLGYKNSELERLLDLPVHTTETRIKITETLESYLKSL